MSAKRDGGPAFPETIYAGNSNRHAADETPGMTLRDWFAGQALAGILAFPGAVEGNRTKSYRTVVNTAYGYADAMIEERSK